MQFYLFIQESLHRLLYPAFSFLVCVNAVLTLDKIAPRLGLLDKPDERKKHTGFVPLIGGPAMFLAIGAATAMLQLRFTAVIAMALGLALVLLGMIDDLLDVRASYRVLVQILVAMCMIFVGGVEIGQVGNLVGLGPVELGGVVSVVFTIVCTVGVINAVNMIDGVDGLAGSILLASFLGLAWLAWAEAYYVESRMAAITCGALLGFLCFNARVFVSRARIFMGDSGSMLLGFLLCWFLISLTQGESPPLSAVSAGWVFGLPLMDTVSVMVKRVLERKSPFAPGRDHLHHRLLDSGMSVNGTVWTMLAIHVAFITIGLAANGRSALDPLLFWGFVVIVVGYHFGFAPVLAKWSSRAARREGS